MQDHHYKKTQIFQIIAKTVRLIIAEKTQKDHKLCFKRKVSQLKQNG